MVVDNLKTQGGPLLITGHTGFKGAWLSLLLGRLGVAHQGYALQPYENSLYKKIGLEELFPSTIGDIRNLDQLHECLKTVQPSTIIHMAAQPLVLRSYVNPLETFETNVIGTANLLEGAFSTPSVKVVLVVTTDKVYKNDGLGRRFNENDPLFGHDPYSASKVGAEAVCAAWQKISSISGGPKVIVARAGNVIGGGDFAEKRIIPDIVRGVISKQNVVIRNPKATRPWQHALDPLYGYLLYLDKTLAGLTEVNALNFGPFEPSLEVRSILEVSSEIFGGKFSFTIEEEKGNREAATLELDATRAKKEIGWSPRWTQREAITDTFMWWKNVEDKKAKALELCNRDIDFLLTGN